VCESATTASSAVGRHVLLPNAVTISWSRCQMTSGAKSPGFTGLPVPGGTVTVGLGGAAVKPGDVGESGDVGEDFAGACPGSPALVWVPQPRSRTSPPRAATPDNIR